MKWGGVNLRVQFCFRLISMVWGGKRATAITCALMTVNCQYIIKIQEATEKIENIMKEIFGTGYEAEDRDEKDKDKVEDDNTMWRDSARSEEHPHYKQKCKIKNIFYD